MVTDADPVYEFGSNLDPATHIYGLCGFFFFKQEDHTLSTKGSLPF